MSWFLVEEKKISVLTYEVEAETGIEAERIVAKGGVKPGSEGMPMKEYNSEVSYKTYESPSPEGTYLKKLDEGRRY